MAGRRPNHRLVKIHRNYTVYEIATLTGRTRNTVRQWVKQGLPTIAHTRPMLVLGADLANYLRMRRLKNRRPCQAGELYCVRCRAPKPPAGEMAEYRPATATLGSLVGICPDCDALMYRRVSVAKLEQVRGKLDIAMPQAPRHISETDSSSVNRDLMQGSRT